MENDQENHNLIKVETLSLNNEITEKLKDEELRDKLFRDKELSNVKNYKESELNFKLKSVFTYPSLVGKAGECFCVRFEYLDRFLAAGFSNGNIIIYDLLKNNFYRHFSNTDYPVTSLRWKPHNNPYKAKGVLLAITAEGTITHWHVDSSKPLYKLIDTDNALTCLDYNLDGSKFAVGGYDKKVKLYDEDMKSLDFSFKSTNFNHPIHSNRVFSVCFHKSNQSLLASGSWDNRVLFYDVKSGETINSIFGPHISGDSLDFKENLLLTGSLSKNKQIQIWDIRKFKLLENIDWEKENKEKESSVYSAQFSKSGTNDLIGVGSSNENLFRVFDRSNRNLPVVTSNWYYKPVYTIDFSYNGLHFAYGNGDGNVRVISLDNEKEWDLTNY